MSMAERVPSKTLKISLLVNRQANPEICDYLDDPANGSTSNAARVLMSLGANVLALTSSIKVSDESKQPSRIGVPDFAAVDRQNTRQKRDAYIEKKAREKNPGIISATADSPVKTELPNEEQIDLPQEQGRGDAAIFTQKDNQSIAQIESPLPEGECTDADIEAAMSAFERLNGSFEFR